MKPIRLTIQMNAYDCYIYGGYVFFIMRSGQILYCSYSKLIYILQDKYDEFSSLIKIAFLRNDYYYTRSADAFLKIPSVRECLQKEWGRLLELGVLTLDYEDIEKELVELCQLPSIPLDVKIYGMRMFVGCTDGMYEIRLRPSDRSINPSKMEKCFDGKVIHLNAKYGEVVMSLGFDGLLATNIDLDGDRKTMVKKEKVINQKSNRTCWADTDIVNYSTPSDFCYYQNVTQERKRSRQKKYWERYETKQITEFGNRSFPMDSLIAKSGLKKDDIAACFNGKEKSFIQLKDGSFVSLLIKDKTDSQKRSAPSLSSRIISIGSSEQMKSFGRMLSGTTIPKGCVLEFMDKVVLFQNSMMQVIEDEEVMKVRSFMNTYRFNDVLAVTKMDTVTLHALDTLNISREPRSPKKPTSTIPADIFNGVNMDGLTVDGNPIGSFDDDSELPF